MATKKSTAIVPWEKKFAASAKAAREQVKAVGGGGVGVKFGRGSISVGGATVPGGKLNCVIIGSCALNSWYEGAYDPNDAQPPSCYAFSTIVNDPEMAPHEEATNKQADLCTGCPKNEYGTATVGRGKAKACGNNIRLGLLMENDVEDADGIATAELATAKVSPTNVKHWAGYVRMLDEEHGRPPWSVVTEIAAFDDPTTQIRLEFRLVDLIKDDAVLTALEAREPKVQDELQRPFPPPIERAKPAAAGRGAKFAAKPAAKGRGR